MTFKLPLEEDWEANLSTNPGLLPPRLRSISDTPLFARLKMISGFWEFCVLLAPVRWSEDDGAGTGVELFAPLFPKLKMISGPANDPLPPNTFSTISGGALVDEAVWPVVPEVEPELELEASVGVLPDELAAVLFEELLGRMPLRLMTISGSLLLAGCCAPF